MKAYITNYKKKLIIESIDINKILSKIKKLKKLNLELEFEFKKGVLFSEYEESKMIVAKQLSLDFNKFQKEIGLKTPDILSIDRFEILSNKYNLYPGSSHHIFHTNPNCENLRKPNSGMKSLDEKKNETKSEIYELKIEVRKIIDAIPIEKQEDFKSELKNSYLTYKKEEIKNQVIRDYIEEYKSIHKIKSKIINKIISYNLLENEKNDINSRTLLNLGFRECSCCEDKDGNNKYSKFQNYYSEFCKNIYSVPKEKISILDNKLTLDEFIIKSDIPHLRTKKFSATQLNRKLYEKGILSSKRTEGIVINEISHYFGILTKSLEVDGPDGRKVLKDTLIYTPRGQAFILENLEWILDLKLNSKIGKNFTIFPLENFSENPINYSNIQKINTILFNDISEILKLYIYNKPKEEVTKEFFLRGLNIPEISILLDKKEVSIFDRLVKDSSLDFSNMYSYEEKNKVIEAIKIVGKERTTPIKEMLPEEFSYSKILFILRELDTLPTMHEEI